MATSFYYVPLAAFMLIMGVITTMVTVKVFLVTTNPDLFLRPAVEAAALEIATVCDEKYNARTLTPAPSGASYIIATCADRNLMIAGTGVVNILQVVGILRDAKNLKDSISEAKGKLVADGADWGTVIKKITLRGSDEMVVPKDIEKLVDSLEQGVDVIVENADEAVALAGNIGEGIDAASDLKRSVKNSRDELEKTKELLKDAKVDGDNLIINCAGREADCESFFRLQRSFSETIEASDKVVDFIRTADAALEERSALMSVIGYNTRSKLLHSSVIKFREGLEQINEIKSVFKETVKRSIQIGTGRLLVLSGLTGLRINREFRILGRILGTYKPDTTENFEAVLDYLDRNDEYFDILSGSFTGVAFTPNIIAAVNNTEDEIGLLANESLVLSGNFTNTSEFIIDNGIKFLSSRGYYTTAEFLGSLESTEIITVDEKTKINSEIIFTSMQDYIDGAEELCEDEACIDYLLDVMETSLDFNLEQSSLNDLLAVVKEYPNKIIKEGERFVSVLEKFQEFEQVAKADVAAVYHMNNKFGEWVGDNCETEVIHLEEYGDVEVSDCAMIFDCSPKSFCFVGLPIVNIQLQDNSMPRPLYLPVTSLNEEDSVSAANVIGLNYDSALKVITPGEWLGCPGDFLSTKSLFICAAISGNKRCKVVNCEKQLNIKPYNLYPNVDVTLENDTVKIWGNFMTW